MSSFISKSKKAIKPRAPHARRNETSASATPSVRGSQEPQRHTPQPAGHNTAVSEALQSSNTEPPTLNQSRPGVSRGPREGIPDRGVSELPPTPAATQLPASPSRHQQHGQDARIASSPRGRAPLSPTHQLVEAWGTPATVQNPDSLPTPLPSQEQSNQSQPNTLARSSVSDATREQGANALLQLSQEVHRNRSEANHAPSEPDNQLNANEPRKLKRRKKGKSASNSGATELEVEPDATGTSPRARRKKAKEPDTGGKGNEAVSPRVQRSRKRKTSEMNQDTAVSPPQTNESRPAATGSKKQNARSKTTSQQQDLSGVRVRRSIEEAAEAIVEAAVGGSSRQKKSRKRKAASGNALTGENYDENGVQEEGKRRGKRAKTPEDAENTAIDVDTQKLGDLTQMRIGRLGPRELKLRERDEQRAAEEKERRQEQARADFDEFISIPEGEERDKAREEKAEREAHEKEEAIERRELEQVWKIEDAGEWSFKPRGRWGAAKKDDEDGEEANEDGNNADENADREDSPYADVFEMNGAGFRVVNGNIVADPGARTLEATKPAQMMEERVESDIDHRVTSASFAYREPRGRWNSSRLALFYEGMRRFGTDFGMVATWVPGMSRNQIKRKYTQEEKLNPDLILDALRKENRIRTSLGEIEEKRGRPLRDPREWQADMDRREEEMRSKARADKAHAEKLQRERGMPNEQLAQNSKQKKSQQQQQQQSTGASGEEEEEEEDMLQQSIESGQAGNGRATAAGSSRAGRVRGRGAVDPPIVNYGMP